jgi:hypothetical protein
MPGRIHSPAHFLVGANGTSAHGWLRRHFRPVVSEFGALIAVQEVEDNWSQTKHLTVAGFCTTPV